MIQPISKEALLAAHEANLKALAQIKQANQTLYDNGQGELVLDQATSVDILASFGRAIDHAVRKVRSATKGKGVFDTLRKYCVGKSPVLRQGLVAEEVNAQFAKALALALECHVNEFSDYMERYESVLSTISSFRMDRPGVIRSLSTGKPSYKVSHVVGGSINRNALHKTLCEALYGADITDASGATAAVDALEHSTKVTARQFVLELNNHDVTIKFDTQLVNAVRAKTQMVDELACSLAGEYEQFIGRLQDVALAYASNFYNVEELRKIRKAEKQAA